MAVVALGENIRAVRRRRGLTLTDLADAVGCSIGWLSQIERGISMPSNEDVRAISDTLDCPVSLLFDSDPGPEIERGFVVRQANRKRLTPRKGLTEELLSPDLTDAFEVVRSEFAPGSGLSEPCTRQTQEVGYVVAGRLQVTIAGRCFDLGTGDSFRIRGDTFVWANPFDETAVVIWVIAPPVY